MVSIDVGHERFWNAWNFCVVFWSVLLEGVWGVLRGRYLGIVSCVGILMDYVFLESIVLF